MPKSSLQAAMAGGSITPKSKEKSAPPPTVTMALVNPSTTSLPEAPIVEEYLSPADCKAKAKNIMNEYFVGGDTDDAVMSMQELVGAGHDGDVARGAAVIEAVVLLVMEMKAEHVDKMLTVVSRCLKEGSMKKESIEGGLQDPLEFLRDIEIDAPHAATLLSTIVAKWIAHDYVTLEMLLSAPEYFLTDGRPAEFAKQVLAKRGGTPSESEVAVVDTLMWDSDKKTYGSASKFLAA